MEQLTIVTLGTGSEDFLTRQVEKALVPFRICGDLRCR